MVRDPFYGAIGAAVVDTEHGAARHQAHVRQACEFVNNAARPDMARIAADFLTFCKQTTAETEVLIADDDARTRTRRHQCRCQTRRACSDDEHVAERVGMFVTVRITNAGAAAQTSGATDDGLIELFPEARWPHEGLVIKAGDEDRAQQRIDRQNIEFQRRPVVLAPRLKPVIELDGGGFGVGFAARTGPQLHERVRLLGARAQYAPGTMILEAASDNTRAFREQRGRQRISGTARGRFPVEAKTKRLRAVDEAAARQPEGLGATHGPAAP